MGKYRDPHYRDFIPANRAERRAAARGKRLEPDSIKGQGRSGMPLLKKWAPREQEK